MDGRPHIRFLRETYGKKKLVMKFYHDELRFENAKQIYDKVAESTFLCKYDSSFQARFWVMSLPKGGEAVVHKGNWSAVWDDLEERKHYA